MIQDDQAYQTKRMLEVIQSLTTQHDATVMQLTDQHNKHNHRMMEWFLQVLHQERNTNTALYLATAGSSSLPLLSTSPSQTQPSEIEPPPPCSTLHAFPVCPTICSMPLSSTKPSATNPTPAKKPLDSVPLSVPCSIKAFPVSPPNVFPDAFGTMSHHLTMPMTNTKPRNVSTTYHSPTTCTITTVAGAFSSISVRHIRRPRKLRNVFPYSLRFSAIHASIECPTTTITPTITGATTSSIPCPDSTTPRPTPLPHQPSYVTAFLSLLSQPRSSFPWIHEHPALSHVLSMANPLASPLSRRYYFALFPDHPG